MQKKSGMMGFRLGIASFALGHATLALMLASPAWGAGAAMSAETSAGADDKSLSAEQRAVLAPLEKVFEGIAKHDRAIAKEQLLPGGMVTLKRGDRIVQMTFDQFVERIPATGAEKLEERIRDPLIRIDDDIAMIWARYVFFVDGKPDHEGTDIVNLVKRDGRWLIAGIADNGRKVPAGH
jgi:hypothetical protein